MEKKAEVVQSHEVKTHFSRVLRRVEAGQEFLITRHNKVIARLVPCDDQAGDAAAAVAAVKDIRALDLSLDEIEDYRRFGQR